MKKLLLFSAISLCLNFSYAQKGLWKKTAPVKTNEFYQITTTSQANFEFDIVKFKELVKNFPNGFVLSLPVEDGVFVDFKLKLNTTMSPELMAKFPDIRAFDGISLDGLNRKAKVDIGPDYFRAMIFTPGKENLYIDPAAFTHTLQNKYILYKRSELISDLSFTCYQQTTTDVNEYLEEKAIQTCELRTYRVAISAAAEYTTFHGGTVPQAQAAQVTTMNRVNGVYERDLAITMTIVGNNDLVIFTNAGSDPFTNGNPGAMIGQNPTALNNAIGSSNYDIGHVFGTDSGGLANLNCVCKSNKGGGVTGSSAPVGDAFDIDYVAHEMGHQFGANHTFNNSCSGNRNNGTAMEPGSGSTIMAYAGICPPNVQNNSDDHFHAISLQEIGTAVSAGSHTCPVKTPLSNVEPNVVSTTGSVTIPASTPFMLKAIATDANGDALTYCWEQMDKEISTQAPVATSTSGPNFRSNSPVSDSVRYFPSITNQINNNFTWERLSSQSRTYKFRVTVRDNAANGSCTDYQDLTITTNATAGPFEVTYPNLSSVIWTGLTTETVTWNVANTTASPVSCSNVSIRISLNGGATFTTLVASTPNDGSEAVIVPNTATTQAIIMVCSANETFFDVSNKKFKIVVSNVGVDELTNNPITIYPNPNQGEFVISFDEMEFIDGYQIINTAGQIVAESTEKLLSNSKISTNHLGKGVYFFESNVNGQKVRMKMIVN